VPVTRLIAVTGYSGAGKTTAIELIAKLFPSTILYVGQLVNDEILRRQLPLGPESERMVRLELRKDNGMAALAGLAAPQVLRELRAGRAALIDAVYNVEEFAHYRAHCDRDAKLISIEASFDIRADRVARRNGKPLSREQLLERDEVERCTLRTDVAITSAALRVTNEASVADLQAQLQSKLPSLLNP